MNQQELWIDTIEEALQAAVVAAGGPKKVASAIWPAKTVADAARLLSHCLDPDRAEKLALGEVVMVTRMGKDAGVHTVMHYLAQELGYETPREINPADELANTQREFTDSVKQQERLIKRMEQLAQSVGRT